jgi:hypothetical protein
MKHLPCYNERDKRQDYKEITKTIINSRCKNKFNDWKTSSGKTMGFLTNQVSTIKINNIIFLNRHSIIFTGIYFN